MTPVQDSSWRRYIVLNGLKFPEIGSWHVQIYAVLNLAGTQRERTLRGLTREVWRIEAGVVEVEVEGFEVGDGPYLCKSFLSFGCVCVRALVNLC